MIYGIGLSSVIAVLALFFGEFIFLGSAVLAILLGILISNTIQIPKIYNTGIGYSEKNILAISVALMGFGLDFTKLQELGIVTIILIIIGIFVAIGSSVFISKLFKIDFKLSLLLGIGNGICGASAIGATKDIVKAKEVDVAISVTVINFLGTVGMFLLPLLALTLGLNQNEAGIFMGNTLQAVGQAVAGGFAYGDIAGANATIVKMGRVLMLAFLIVVLIFIFVKSEQGEISNNQQNSASINPLKTVWRNIPLFIIFFIVFSTITTLISLPHIFIDLISKISNFLLLVSMGAIGLRITFASIKENGKVALLVGTLIFLIQIIFTLSFVIFFIR